MSSHGCRPLAALMVMISAAPRAAADPVCLVSRGKTLYRFNGGGAGSVETFENQPGAIIGMTCVPEGVTVAGCVAGDVLAVEVRSGGRFWRVDNAACGAPALVQVGQLPSSQSITSLAFAHGQLYGIGGAGKFREFDPMTFELVAPGVNVTDGPTNIGGLAFDGVATWYVSDAMSDALYRFDDPPAPNSWVPVGPAGLDFGNNGLELHGEQIWAALRVPGSPVVLKVGTFDMQTGLFTEAWTDSQGLQGQYVGFVALPEVPGLRGDVNCDGSVDGLDVTAFVLALTNPGGFTMQYPDCGILGADLSGDCQVNGNDVQAFVDQLLG